MRTFAQAIDLVDDAAAIAEYERLHRSVWPEVTDALRQIGILSMRIYRCGTRLFMVIETDDGFEPARDYAAYAEQPRAREWDALMRRYQRQVPGASPERWWTPMNLVFELD